MFDAFDQVRGLPRATTRSVVALAMSAMFVAGCGVTPQHVAKPYVPEADTQATAGDAEATSLSDAFRPAAAGAPQNAGDDLLGEQSVREQQRRQASVAATNQAERLFQEQRYVDAEVALQEALRLDANNARAKELLQDVLLLLGDLRGETSAVGRLAAERERVRRQQAIYELRQMVVQAQREYNDGRYTRAAQIYEQLLERIRWFPYQNDLTDLRLQAQQGKTDSEAQAQAQARAERRAIERRAAEDAQFEVDRNLRYIQNRIDRLEENLDRRMEERRFEQAINLAEQILELDPGNVSATRKLREARELRHLYRKAELLDRAAEERKLTLLGQLEAEIPYSQVFNFPSRDDWRRITRKTLSIEDRLVGRESTEGQEIELRLKTRINVDFSNEEPFEQVIDFLSQTTGVNFVLSREAREALDSDDSPVELAPIQDLAAENVLELVLETRDPAFGYTIKNGAVLIGPADSIGDNLFLEFYEIRDLIREKPDFLAPELALDEGQGDAGAGGGSASSIIDFGGEDEGGGQPTVDPEVIVELLEGALYGEDGDAPEGASIEYQNGKLVVRASLEDHQKVQQLLDQLREQTGVMVTVESRFLDLQDNFLQTIGIDFGSPFSSNLPNPISDIDGAGTQISPGYEFTDAQGQFNLRAASFTEFSQALGSSVAPFNISEEGGLALQYNVLDTYILEAILEANAKEQEFKKLDAPRVTAFNGQTSHSLVVEQEAFIRDAEVNQTGVVPVINPVIGILNSGSILQVRPTVSHDRKYVILEIEPTLAVQLPSRFETLILNATVLTVEFPVLNVTRIKTTVTVPDGGTVLVGGLKRTVVQEQQIGTPWTRHIPGLNLLFGRKGESRLQSNLFVLINAKITVIRDEEAALFN